MGQLEQIINWYDMCTRDSKVSVVLNFTPTDFEKVKEQIRKKPFYEITKELDNLFIFWSKDKDKSHVWYVWNDWELYLKTCVKFGRCQEVIYSIGAFNKAIENDPIGVLTLSLPMANLPSNDSHGNRVSDRRPRLSVISDVM